MRRRGWSYEGAHARLRFKGLEHFQCAGKEPRRQGPDPAARVGVRGGGLGRERLKLPARRLLFRPAAAAALRHGRRRAAAEGGGGGGPEEEAAAAQGAGGGDGEGDGDGDSDGDGPAAAWWRPLAALLSRLLGLPRSNVCITLRCRHTSPCLRRLGIAGSPYAAAPAGLGHHCRRRRRRRGPPRRHPLTWFLPFQSISPSQRLHSGSRHRLCCCGCCCC